MERCLIDFDYTLVERQSRFEAIAPLVQLFDIPISRRFPHLLPDGTRAWSLSDAVAWCAANNDLCTRTIWRRFAKFKNAGKGALESAARKDKGLSRFFTQHDKAAAFAAYLYLVLRPSVRAVHGAIVRNCELLDVAEAQLPSRETVRLWLRSTRPALVALALEGQRTYRALMFSELERGLLAAAKDWSE